MRLQELKSGWNRHRGAVLTGAVALMAVIAAAWLAYEFWRLAGQSGGMGAVDLKLRRMEVRGWFAGEPVYRMLSNAVYPPASYLMLWPFLGWLDVQAARWFFAVANALALCVIAGLTVRHSQASSIQDRLLMALAPLAIYPTGASLGNGQLGILVVLCLLAGLPLLSREKRTGSRDLLIAVWFLLSLVKPSVSVYFFWIVLFAAGGLRPAFLTCGGYALLTLAASVFQNRNPVLLMHQWIARGMEGAAYGATRGEGAIKIQSEGFVKITSINLHSVLGYFELGAFNATASLVLLAFLGFFIFRCRRSPLWILIGLTALTARFCTYHGWYDDVLLLLPLIALFRIARGEARPGNRPSWMAGVLFASMLLSLLAPGGTYVLPNPWNNIYVIGQTLIWLGVLFFLAALALRAEAG